jgi:hypothetical protein
MTYAVDGEFITNYRRLNNVIGLVLRHGVEIMCPVDSIVPNKIWLKVKPVHIPT